MASVRTVVAQAAAAVPGLGGHEPDSPNTIQEIWSHQRLAALLRQGLETLATVRLDESETVAGQLAMSWALAMLPPGHRGDPDFSSGDDESEGELRALVEQRRPRQLLKKARVTKFLIVELPGRKYRLHNGGEAGCWLGRRRRLKSSREFSSRPDRSEYTHVCRLCWPKGKGENSQDSASESSQARTGDEDGQMASPRKGSTRRGGGR